MGLWAEIALGEIIPSNLTTSKRESQSSKRTTHLQKTRDRSTEYHAACLQRPASTLKLVRHAQLTHLKRFYKNGGAWNDKKRAFSGNAIFLIRGDSSTQNRGKWMDHSSFRKTRILSSHLKLYGVGHQPGRTLFPFCRRCGVPLLFSRILRVPGMYYARACYGFGHRIALSPTSIPGLCNFYFQANNVAGKKKKKHLSYPTQVIVHHLDKTNTNHYRVDKKQNILNTAHTKLKRKKKKIGTHPSSEKTHPHSILQVPTTLAKMSLDPKFVELTADVLENNFINCFFRPVESPQAWNKSVINSAIIFTSIICQFQDHCRSACNRWSACANACPSKSRFRAPQACTWNNRLVRYEHVL